MLHIEVRIMSLHGELSTHEVDTLTMLSGATEASLDVDSARPLSAKTGMSGKTEAVWAPPWRETWLLTVLPEWMDPSWSMMVSSGSHDG